MLQCSPPCAVLITSFVCGVLSMLGRVRRVMCMAAAVVIFSIAASTVGLAGPAAGPEDEITYKFDFWDLKEGAKFAKYYRAHAHVSPQSAAEPERILASGVRWRLLVDERTGMRMPRITWMPNRQSMTAANDFLEMAHGAAIAEADSFDRTWLGYNTIRRAVSDLPPYS